MDLVTSDKAAPDLCLEALELVMMSAVPPPPQAAPDLAARIDQQQQQQQQHLLSGTLLPALKCLVNRVPAQRGVLSVKLLLRAAQAHQVR
jgi:hypothetical protein